MDDVLDEILNRVLVEKEVIERLIAIDNLRSLSNLTFEEFYDNLKKVINDNDVIETKDNTLFITEGSPYLTIQILKSLVSGYKYILFINQKFVGLNEWLITRYIKLTDNEINITLDIDINYNKYIKNNKYRIVPLGEKEFINEVINDFKGE